MGLPSGKQCLPPSSILFVRLTKGNSIWCANSCYRDSDKVTHFFDAELRKLLKMRAFRLALEHLPCFHSKERRMELISWSRISKGTWQVREAQENTGHEGSERNSWQEFEAAECKWTLRNISRWLGWWKTSQMMWPCREPSGVTKESGIQWVNINERLT